MTDRSQTREESTMAQSVDVCRQQTMILYNGGNAGCIYDRVVVHGWRYPLVDRVDFLLFEQFEVVLQDNVQSF